MGDTDSYNQPTVQDATLFHQNKLWNDNFSRVDLENLLSIEAKANHEPSDGTNNTSSESTQSCGTVAPFSFPALPPALAFSHRSNAFDLRLSNRSLHDVECKFRSGEAMTFEGKRFYFLDIEDSNSSQPDYAPTQDHHGFAVYNNNMDADLVFGLMT